MSRESAAINTIVIVERKLRDGGSERARGGNKTRDIKFAIWGDVTYARYVRTGDRLTIISQHSRYNARHSFVMYARTHTHICTKYSRLIMKPQLIVVGSARPHRT